MSDLFKLQSALADTVVNIENKWRELNTSPCQYVESNIFYHVLEPFSSLRSYLEDEGFNFRNPGYGVGMSWNFDGKDDE